MLRKLGRAIYRGVFWAHVRGSWQYDIMAILILAFIFLTPRQWFDDRPAPATEPANLPKVFYLNHFTYEPSVCQHSGDRAAIEKDHS